MARTVLTGATVLMVATIGLDAQSGPIARAVAQAAAEIDDGGGTRLPDIQASRGDAAWARMRSLVPVGSAIRITLPDRASIRGTLRGTDEASLTITVAGSDRTVPRTDVLRVFAPSGTHRKRHVNIGMAIGAVAGSFVMARRHCPFRDNICQEESAAYAMSLMVGGAAVGRWVPQGVAWRQIYGRPAP
jgi:hypothetical protein